MRSTSLFLTLLLLAVGVPARAQVFTRADSVLASLAARVSAEPTWHLGIGGGMSLPLTDARLALQNGFNGEVYLAWLPRGPLGLRLTANADRHVLKGSSPDGPVATGTLIGGLGGITIGASSGAIRPYITVGAGAFSILIERNGTRTSSIKFGAEAGAGMQLHLGRVAVFAEGRLQNLFNPPSAEYGTDKTLEQMEAQIVPVTFGLHF